MRINIRFLSGAVVGLVAVASIAPVTTAAADLRLVEAAKHGDTEAVRTLLMEGVPVNTPPPDGVTALHWAALGDDVEMADLLIRGGALVNATDHYDVTPLSLACTNASPVMVERLLEAGANPNAAQATGETVSKMDCFFLDGWTHWWFFLSEDFSWECNCPFKNPIFAKNSL